jgi:thymidylate synthase
MNKVIQGQTLNVLTQELMKEVINGDVSTSRNGDVHYLNNALLELGNPRARHLHLEGRKNNIFATFAEVFWVLAGDEKIDPYLSYFLPRAVDFSDDQETWRGAYGPRIYAHNQVQGVIDIFKHEGLDSRRAVISIYDSMKDSPSGLKEIYRLQTSKDIPCNNMLHFYVRDGKLNCNAFSRSGDVVWGVTNINIVEWTVLMEYIAQEIGVDVGIYSHFVTNVHIYEFTKSQVEAVLSADFQPLGGNSKPMIFPTGNNKARYFSKDFVSICSDLITDDKITIEMALSGVHSLFARYEIPTEGNIIWDYMRSIVAYIEQKKNGTEFTLEFEEGDFKDAILSSSFRKFGVK